MQLLDNWNSPPSGDRELKRILNGKLESRSSDSVTMSCRRTPDPNGHPSLARVCAIDSWAVQVIIMATSSLSP